MRRNPLKLAATSTSLALAMLIAGCENLPDLAGPELTPQAPAHSITMAKETECSVGADVSAKVGPEGGNLKVCKHELTIPAGAVSAPTVFVMKKLDNKIKVELTATSFGSLVENDVGSAGFLKPLTLRLSYRNAGKLPDDLSSLRVYWLKTDGSKVEQASTLDTSAKTVTSLPSHFSLYGIGWPNRDGGLLF